ncbi:MAG: hypothetical protein E6J69_09175 [Deltaproteobacteria bacterium]|nr:MAG: hypothetical protein E6J69_09175 [Deltaproteobacteria bacterium]
MDSAALVAVAVIVGVPAAFVAARICTEPFTGLCLWVLLLPVTKTVASLMGYPFGAGPIVLQKLTLADPVLLLTAFGAWVSASGAAGALGERQGRRIVGLLAAFCTVGILSATLGPTGSESLIELATYVWLCVSLVVICRLLGSRERARRVLSAWRWAGAVACAAGGAATVLLWRGSLDNLLVQGGRVAGLFEGINQLQSFMIAVIPFLCARALSSAASRGARALHGALVVIAFLSVVASGSRGGVVFAALSIWLMVMLTSPRLCLVWTCAALLAAGSAWRQYERHHDELPYGIRRAVSFLESDSHDLRDMSPRRADQLVAWRTVFAEHPLLGVGPGGFAATIPELVPGGLAQEMHNSYLGVLAETGAVGSLLMFGLLAAAMARSVRFLGWTRRARDPEALMVARALLVSYLSLLLYGMLNYGLRQRHFWFVIALIVALPHIYPRARPGVRVAEHGTPLAYGTVRCAVSQA